MGSKSLMIRSYCPTGSFLMSRSALIKLFLRKVFHKSMPPFLPKMKLSPQSLYLTGWGNEMSACVPLTRISSVPFFLRIGIISSALLRCPFPVPWIAYNIFTVLPDWVLGLDFRKAGCCSIQDFYFYGCSSSWPVGSPPQNGIYSTCRRCIPRLLDFQSNPRNSGKWLPHYCSSFFLFPDDGI